jgi:hypothetical protein
MNSLASSVEELKRSISDMADSQPSEDERRKRSRPNDSTHESGIVADLEPQRDIAGGGDIQTGQEEAMEEPSFRSAEDCVSDIFAEDEEKEGVQVCNLCV